MPGLAPASPQLSCQNTHQTQRTRHNHPPGMIAVMPGTRITAKKINGRKRHIAVDTLGLLLAVVVTIAGIQDRDAAHRLLTQLRGRFTTVSLVWADGGYAGRLVAWASRSCT